MKNKCSTSFRVSAVLMATLLCVSLSTSISQAVTNGSLVSDPKSAAPYVVSIWTSEKSNDYKDAEFICTGTLIGPQVVLTAAHCTTLNTPYFVKVGAEALNDNTNFTAVSGVWTSPRYNSKTFANDIGLLKIEERFENIEFPTLASQTSAKSINKFSKLRIFGWGLDQEEVLADLLRTSELALQDALAVKTFGKSFVPATMLAAGRKIVSENVWSGACNGDSGGPLLSTINGINVIVGVTSWGARKCLPNRPSIFTRVSYFEKDIRQGIKEVEAQSVVVNRTAPIATTEPTLVGRAVPGSELKCSPGVWKNAVSIQTAWTSPARLVGSTKTEVTVLPTDGGSEFKCEIIVASTGASVRRILRTSISGKATLTSEPIISGIGNSTLRSGMTARCEGWNWRIPVDSERITWFTSSSNAPTVPVNGRQIATGSTITFDSNILKGESGRYLICQVTGIKDGFESHFTASKLITTPSAPSLNNVSVSAYSLSVGSSATCSYSSYGDVEITRIEWGYTSNTGFFNPIAGFAGNRISITSDIARQAAGKALSCRVTLINSGGEVSKIASTYSNFDDLPAAANVSVSISGTPEAGKTAYCTATSSNSWSVSTSYQWGKTSFSGSKTIEGQVLSTNNYYTLNSSDIAQLGGNYLTCVVMVTNSIGSTASAASVSIPATVIQVPVSAAPTVDLQTPSTTSVTVRIRIPLISGYNASTMKAVLNLMNAPSCRSIEVVPGQAYECAGLAANTTYLADITVSPRTGNGISRASDNLRFTTIGLNSNDTIAPTIMDSSYQYTGYEKIIPTSGNPGTDIAVRFVARDVTGVASTSVRLINPSNVVVSTANGVFQSGSNTDGAYRANIATASSGPKAGDTYRIEAQARDTAGNLSAWFYLGNFTVTNQVSIPTPAAPTFTPISSTKVKVALPGIPGFNANTMSAQLYIYWQTSLTAVGIDGSATSIEVNANSGKTHTGYVVLRRLSDGYEIKSTIVYFTMPSADLDTQAPEVRSGTVSYGPLTGFATVDVNLVDVSGVASCRSVLYNSNNVDVASSTNCSRVSGTSTNGTWRVTFDLQNSAYNPGNYSVKVAATDLMGNASSLVNVGDGFTKPGASVNTLSSLPIPITIGINYVDQIVLNGFNLGNLGASPSNFTWTVQTLTTSGSLISSLPVGSNQTYITGLAGGTTYNVVLVATDSAGKTKISSPLTVTTLAPAVATGLTPTFGARTPDYYSPGFRYQIANYDPAFTWSVSSTVGTATINSSGLVSVAGVGAKQSATLTVSTSRSGYTSASASVSSVGPWNLSDEIQTQNITATLNGTTLTINVPDARGWNWSVIWDGTVQRTNISSFPFVITGFSTNKNIQLGAVDNLQNYGYSKVFLPTITGM